MRVLDLQQLILFAEPGLRATHLLLAAPAIHSVAVIRLQYSGNLSSHRGNLDRRKTRRGLPFRTIRQCSMHTSWGAPVAGYLRFRSCCNDFIWRRGASWEYF